MVSQGVEEGEGEEEEATEAMLETTGTPEVALEGLGAGLEGWAAGLEGRGAGLED